jgi:hypothetical protein
MDFIRHFVSHLGAQPKALASNALSATKTTESTTRLLVRTMRLTGLILLAFCLQVSARCDSHQGKANDVTSIKGTTPVTMAVKDTIVEDTPVIMGQGKTVKVRGFVLTEEGIPVQGASVIVRQTEKATITNAEGAFEFSYRVPAGSVLMIGYIGYATQNFKVMDQGTIRIYIKVVENDVDKLVVQAYGTTTQRLTTADIGKMTSDEIERQPGTNPLEALEGKVPGLMLYQPVKAHALIARKISKRAMRFRSDLGSSATAGNFQISKKCKDADINTIIVVLIQCYKTRLERPPFSAAPTRDIDDEIRLEIDGKQNFILLGGKYERSTFNVRVKSIENNPPDLSKKLDVIFDYAVSASYDVNTCHDLDAGDKNKYIEAITELHNSVIRDLEQYYVCRQDPTGKIFILKRRKSEFLL